MSSDKKESSEEMLNRDEETSFTFKKFTVEYQTDRINALNKQIDISQFIIPHVVKS